MSIVVMGFAIMCCTPFYDNNINFRCKYIIQYRMVNIYKFKNKLYLIIKRSRKSLAFSSPSAGLELVKLLILGFDTLEEEPLLWRLY